ncbi:toxin C-terminal domain-containing protein [Terrisporobacter vanillatitrophus]
MKKSTFIKIISYILTICITVTNIPMSVFAEEISKSNSTVEEGVEEMTEGIIEKTKNKTVYQLKNGLKKEVIHDSNIRYYDDGKLIDNDPSLVEIKEDKTSSNTDLADYAYENKDGENKHYFPEKVSDDTPILLENNKYQISMHPIMDESKKVKLGKEKTTNIYDEEVNIPIKASYEFNELDSEIEYISYDNGIKENIILNKVPESNKFEFEIYAKYLEAKKCEIEESIVFYDKDTKEVVASIDAPFMNDATNKAYSEDITYDIKLKEDSEDVYILTMTVDEDYLNSKDRQYPVKIDPTITWTGDSNIIDTYIISGSSYADVNFYNSGTTAFPVGTGSQGINRSLIKGKKLFSTVEGKYVEKATLTLSETSNNDSLNKINAYRIIDDWNEKTVTWNNKPRYNTSDGAYGSFTTTGTLYKERNLNLTTYAKKVANGQIKDYGLMLKAEDETTSTGKYSKFYGSRHSNTSLRPKLELEYYDIPQQPTSVGVSPQYMNGTKGLKVSWEGIVSTTLSRVEYRVSKCDDSGEEIDPQYIPYKTLKTTSSSSGSATISDAINWPSGRYRIYVRGVDNRNISGVGRWRAIYIDKTKPVIESMSVTPISSSTNQIGPENISISWKVNEKYLKDVQYSIDEGSYSSVGSAAILNSKYTISSSKFNDSKSYKIRLKAIDKSGNISSIKSADVYIDKTAPKIGELELKDSSGNIVTDIWTREKKPQICFSNVTEEGSGIAIENIKYNVVKSGDDKPESYSSPNDITFTSSVNPYEGYFYRNTEGYSGAYDIYVKITDKAGNVTIERVTSKRDTIGPTGSIQVENLTSSTELLSNTINITGIVEDKDGSGIKTSNITLHKLDANGQEDTSFQPVVIYENATISNSTAFDTKKLENGKYILKLYVEDNVAYKKTITKEITIANKINAPKLISNPIKDNPATVSWRYDDSSMIISGIQYKLSDSNEWVEVKDSNKSTGDFTVNLPEINGEYEVKVRAIDKYGFEGDESAVMCTVDRQNPTVNITSVDNGIVKGTVTDENFSEWKIYIKKESEEDSSYQFLLEGNNSVEDKIIGILDLQDFEVGTYNIKLVGKDIVGNEESSVVSFEKNEDFTNAQLIQPSFRVEREYYQDYNSHSIVLKSTKNELSLKYEGLNLLSMFMGTTNWYVDNKNVGAGSKYEDDFSKYERNKNYQISVVNKDLLGNVKYSMPLIKNYEVKNISLSDANSSSNSIVKNIKFDDKIASFRLLYTNIAKEISYEIKIGNGEYTKINPEETYNIIDLSDEIETESIFIRVSGTNNSDIQNLNDISLQLDYLNKEYFTISDIENYRPENLSAKDKINYKTYIKWDIPEGEFPKDIYYEVYRGTEPNFKPSSYTLVAKDVQAGYWSEPNINYSSTFYYKIRAVKRNKDGSIIEASSYSDEVSSTVVDSDEYTKRMGIKEYWEYVDVEMPNGTGHIEKSEGNFVYQQTDAVLPNEELEVNLNRTYNSKSSAKSAFGIGWNHDYDIEILSLCENDKLDEGKIALKDSTGTIYYFYKKYDGTYISTMGKYINLLKEDITDEVKIPDRSATSQGNAEITKTINSSYTITTKDNNTYRFNSGGQLIYMSDANNNFLLFEYDNNKGLISKITTSKNIPIEFVYNDVPGQDLLTVKEIILPDNSKIQYNYKNSKLISVDKVGEKETITYKYEYDSYDSNGKVNKVLDAEGNSYGINYDSEHRANEIVYPHASNLFAETVNLEYSDKATKTTTKKLVNGNVRSSEVDEFDSAFGNCLRSTDAEGFTTTYEYTNNLRTKETSQVDYQALENEKVVWKKTEKSETTSYDNDENVTKETEEDGSTSSYQYNNDKNNEALNDLPTSLTEYDGDGKLITDEIYEYDQYGNTTKVYDKITNTTLLTTYTEDGEVESETEILGSPSSGNVQSEAKYTYSYDEKGNKTEINTEVADGTKVVTTTVYDVMGRQISCEEIFTETSGKTSKKITTNTFDSFGRLIKTVYQEGDKVTTTEKSYYPNGTTKSETAEDGTVTTYTYDEMNREASETVQKDTLTKTWNTTYSYETVETFTGGGTKRTEYSFVSTETNPDGYIIGQTYQDALGRTIREKENGVYVDLTYDGQENIITKYEAGQNAGSEKGNLSVFLYDSLGNQTTSMLNPAYDSNAKTFYVDGDNTITTTKKYDSSGNVIEDIDGEGNSTKYEYDEEARISKVILPDSENNITSFTYDKINTDGTTSTVVTDANGNRSETITNSQDLAVLIKDLGDGFINSITTATEYNSKDNVVKETNTEGNYKTYEYDDKERLSALNYYDSKNNRTLRTEYKYESDILDNLVAMIDYKQSGDKLNLYRYTGYTYDKLKRLVGYAELDADDISGDLPTDEEIASHKITYEYDIDDNITNVTYPSSTSSDVKGLKFTYNSDKWLQKIEAKVGLSNKLLREYNYLNDGKVASIKDYRDFAKGSTNIYTLRSFNYDNFGRATNITYIDSGNEEVLEKYEYTYNKNNHIMSEYLYNNYTSTTQRDEDSPNTIVDELREYKYDKLGRLTETNINDNISNTISNTAYTYDKVGNRVKEVKDGKTTTYTYNSLNQLVSSVEVGSEDSEGGGEESSDDDGESHTTLSDKTYTYDGNGNQLRESDSVTNEVKCYTYDAADRMNNAMFTKAGIVTLNQVNTYNGNGQRVEKSENGQSTKYYYQNDAVLYTTGKADTSTELEEPDDTEILTGVTSLNLMGNSENAIATVRDISSTEGEKYYFYNKDMRESTTNLVNVEGKSEVSYEYTDFGETEINGDENFYNEICYTGGIYDNKTGLYYLNARYYNPEDGRFLTEDTYRGEFTDPSSLHLYAYCVNNPVAYTDPSGHFPVWGVINAAWGAYDGYQYAKKKNLRGWKKAGAIAGGAVLGTINPFKKLKVAKKIKRVVKVAKKRKSTKVYAKRVYKTVRKSSKPKASSRKISKKVSKVSSKKKTTTNTKIRRTSNKKVNNKDASVCFEAGTLVSTEEGLVPIEDIKEGDLVWSQNPETGEVKLKKVEQLFINKSNTILKIKVAEEIIEATEQHVFYIDNIGWIPANMIEEGDKVVLQSGEKAIVEDIDKVIYDNLITVYNFEVEDFHTYFVSDASVLVHNMCAQKVSTRLTAKEAEKLAESMGFYKIKRKSHGQPIFYNKKKKKYITPDVDSHNGGVWKKASTIEGLASRKTRDGTFDINLDKIGD